MAPVSFHGVLDLRFSGFIRRGEPFFVMKRASREKGPGEELVQWLNKDQGLLAECLRLEVEYLKVLFDPLDGGGRVQIRPYGGSLIQMALPPLKYHVKLIREQAELFLSVMERIGNLYQSFQATDGLESIPTPT